MLKITAPVSTLTTFIVPDGERLHFSTPSLKMTGPDTRSTVTCPLHSLAIFPSVKPRSVHKRLSHLTDIPCETIAAHLAPIDAGRPFFHLVHRPDTSLQTADLHLPLNQYRRLESALQQASPHNLFSIPIDVHALIPAVTTLPSGKPCPLALLFLLEHRILCHAVPRLEIAIDSSWQFSGLHPQASCHEYQGA